MLKNLNIKNTILKLFFKLKANITKVSQNLRFKLYLKYTDYAKIQINPFNQTYNPITPTGNLSLLVNYVIWQNDINIKKKIFLNNSEKKNVNNLFSNGYQIVQSDDFKKFNNQYNFSKILNLFENNFNAKTDTEEILKQNIFFIDSPTIFFEDLIKLYEIQEINKIVKNYLGADACLHNGELMKLSKNTNSSQGSALYHHDTIGHRLKIYFNFNSVEKLIDRPTHYAKSSHINFWPEHNAKTSRFDEKYVNDEFIVDKLYSKSDEIVIFDTNGLHKGYYNNNNNERYSLVLEYGTIKKFKDFKRLGNFPYGIKKQKISKKINLSKTLINQDYLVDKGDYYNYGEHWWKETQPLFYYG
jgi:hypothetical protein